MGFVKGEIIKSTSAGTFLCGDCVVCAKALLPDFAGQADLIYIDPPFCTGDNFTFGAETAYTDRLPEGEYMRLMREILTLSREMLSETGSIYVHIDYRMSAKMRLILDEVFGEENFRNEIIWAYKSGGRTKKYFPRKHDTIFFYSKTDNYYFNIENTGIPRGRMKRNNLKRNVDADGRIYFSITSHGREYRYYEDEPVYPTDVWTDIEHLHQRDGERTGYPTQKPLALLERIISASSPEGGLVCDFFSGSGTTAHACAVLGRRFIVCDNSPLALQSLKKRLPEGEREVCIMEYDNDDK